MLRGTTFLAGKPQKSAGNGQQNYDSRTDKLVATISNGTQFGKGEACAPESGQHRLLLCLA